MTDFSKIEYLKRGNNRQRRAYEVLSTADILTSLKAFDPILVGTIPIEIDLEHSDLDIVCCFKDIDYFLVTVRQLFSHFESCVITTRPDDQSVLARFRIGGFDIEIFGQFIPSMEQSGYRHMVVEHKLLQAFGESFRKEIIRLKSLGYKTEPAFAVVLGLAGDPYDALLECNLDEIIAKGWLAEGNHNQDFEGK